MAGAGGHVSSMFFDLVPGVRIGEVPLHAKTGNCAELDSFFFAPKALECRINSYYICMYTYIYIYDNGFNTAHNKTIPHIGFVASEMICPMHRCSCLFLHVRGKLVSMSSPA